MIFSDFLFKIIIGGGGTKSLSTCTCKSEIKIPGSVKKS